MKTERGRRTLTIKDTDYRPVQFSTADASRVRQALGITPTDLRWPKLQTCAEDATAEYAAAAAAENNRQRGSAMAEKCDSGIAAMDSLINNAFAPEMEEAIRAAGGTPLRHDKVSQLTQLLAELRGNLEAARSIFRLPGRPPTDAARDFLACLAMLYFAAAFHRPSGQKLISLATACLRPVSNQSLPSDAGRDVLRDLKHAGAFTDGKRSEFESLVMSEEVFDLPLRKFFTG